MTERVPQFLESLIKLVRECGCIHGDADRAIEYLTSSDFSMSSDPRVETEDNAAALYAMQSAIMNEVKGRYGEFERNRIFPRPFYMQAEREKNSRIMALLEQHDVGIKVGMMYDTWERVFYQVCHETVHLLNPAFAPVGQAIIATTLDEGVAVKFAESMYAKSISYYCPLSHLDSPLLGWDNKYKQAFDAASKIPDSTLRAIRLEFGSFARVGDEKRLLELADGCIDEKDARLLASNFQ